MENQNFENSATLDFAHQLKIEDLSPVETCLNLSFQKKETNTYVNRENEMNLQQEFVLQGSQNSKNMANSWIKPYIKVKKIAEILNLRQKFQQDDKQKEYYALERLEKENFFTLEQSDIQSQSRKMNNIVKKSDEMQNENLKYQMFSQNQQNQDYWINNINNKNYSKIFITVLIKFFKLHAIENSVIPKKLKQELYNVVESCRKSARCFRNKKIIRSDMFSHLHYGLLFLKIDESNIHEILKCDRMVELHKTLFNIDLEEYAIYVQKGNNLGQCQQKVLRQSKKIKKNCNNNQYQKNKNKQCSFKEIFNNNKESSTYNSIEIESNSNVDFSTEILNLDLDEQNNNSNNYIQEDIEYVNFLKCCLYQLSIQYLKPVLIPSSYKVTILKKQVNSQIMNNNENENPGYIQRLFKGLKKLNSGIKINRF